MGAVMQSSRSHDSNHKDFRRPDDYIQILDDIRAKNFNSLRAKYLELIAEKPEEGGPQDKIKDIEKLGYSRLKKAALPEGKDTAFTKWKNVGSNPDYSQEWPFTVVDAEKLLEYCWKETYWSQSEWQRRCAQKEHNTYFFTLINEMGCGDTTLRSLSDKAEGIYQTWCQSTIFKDTYLLGLAAIFSEEDGAIKTIEIQKLPAIKDEKTEIIQQPAFEEIFFGYMVKKGQQIMIHAFDSATKAFKFTAIVDSLRAANFAIDSDLYIAMKGMEFQIIGQKNYFRAKAFFRQDSIDDLLLKSDDILAKEKDNFPGLSVKEIKILLAMRSMPIYQHLALVNSNDVPFFVKGELDDIRPS
jgi:hypothetical protein